MLGAEAKRERRIENRSPPGRAQMRALPGLVYCRPTRMRDKRGQVFPVPPLLRIPLSCCMMGRGLGLAGNRCVVNLTA